MNRREFLSFKKNEPVAAPVSYTGLRQISSGLNPYTGVWTKNEVAHLLKRTMFGARKADIDYFLGMSASQAVDILLTAAAAPAPPIKEYNNSGTPSTDADYSVPMGGTWVNTYSNDGGVTEKRIGSVKSWLVGNMINQDRSITEKMRLFWHNHFATQTSIYTNGSHAYNHFAMLGNYALGNFRQLVKAVTIDAAMLIYLNGEQNANTAPDENYARELQELFTLGKENSPNYAEDDVKAAARVLTGWRVNQNTGAVYFDATRHDAGNKTFSSFYNGTVIAGRAGATAGDAELDDMLNMIFSKSTEVSEFIVRKLYRWFCYYAIDDNTNNNVIKPLAQILRGNNWEIKPVLAALFKSDHFFDPLNQGCLIKSPVDFIVGQMREFNVAIPDVAADYATAYSMWNFLRLESEDMQQDIGDPPSVSGWAPYYQAPQFHEMWISSDTLPKRDGFSDLMLVNGRTENGQKLIIDPVGFARSLPNAADPNQLISDSLDILYRVPLSAASQATIKTQILLSNQTQDYYWSNAWVGYISNPSDMVAYQTVYTRLQALFKYFVDLAEYQLS